MLLRPARISHFRCRVLFPTGSVSHAGISFDQHRRHAILQRAHWFPDALSNNSGDSLQIAIGHCGAGRQTKPFCKELFTNGAATHAAAFENRLQMHWLPDGTGLDVFGFERKP